VNKQGHFYSALVLWACECDVLMLLLIAYCTYPLESTQQLMIEADRQCWMSKCCCCSRVSV